MNNNNIIKDLLYKNEQFIITIFIIMNNNNIIKYFLYFIIIYNIYK